MFNLFQSSEHFNKSKGRGLGINWFREGPLSAPFKRTKMRWVVATIRITPWNINLCLHSIKYQDKLEIILNIKYTVRIFCEK